LNVNISVYEARLRAPWVSSRDSVSVRPLIVLGLEGADGVAGFGEAAPLAGYGGVSAGDVLAALAECRGVLEGADGVAHADVLARCAEVTVLPQALAAVDLALWDLEGRRAGEPVWRLLGASDPEPVAVNWTIASADRAGAAAEASNARERGFETVKVKVGIGDDAGRLAAVRAAAGLGRAIRIDANGAWSPAEARAHLRVLEPAGIELCEEPVRGREAIRALSAQTPIPLALDESAADPGALDRQVCALACLKISSCGGLTGLLSAAARARAAGYEVYLASTLDGPLGIAAALHAAAVLSPTRACGLATLALFSGRTDPLPAAGGALEVPHAPGLGEGLLAWYGSR